MFDCWPDAAVAMFDSRTPAKFHFPRETLDPPPTTLSNPELMVCVTMPPSARQMAAILRAGPGAGT